MQVSFEFTPALQLLNVYLQAYMYVYVSVQSKCKCKRQCKCARAVAEIPTIVVAATAAVEPVVPIWVVGKMQTAMQRATVQQARTQLSSEHPV